MLHSRRYNLILLTLAVYCLACVRHVAADLSAKLRAAASSNGILELDSGNYDQYTATPRTYGIVVLLTATSPEHACVPCRELDPEYRLVASNWQNQKVDDNALFFGSVEFKRGVDVYKKLGLTSAPTILYLPPSEGPNASKVTAKYDMNRRGLSAESIADWVSNLSGKKIHVVRPIDYTKYAVTAIGIVVAAGLVKLLVTTYGHLFMSSGIWTSFSLVIILMMCSGHMWNHIRNPPYMVPSRNGMEWIAPGFQSQYVLESQVFAILQAIAGFAVVVLAVKVPKQTDATRQVLLSYIAITVLIVDFSFMLWLFRIKNGGYPFKLLF